MEEEKKNEDKVEKICKIEGQKTYLVQNFVRK